MSDARRRSPRACRSVVLVGLLLLPAGCSGDGGSDPSGASIRIVSGSGQADTATTELPLPLVVEVRDETGRPAVGVDVRVGDPTCAAGCLALPLASPGAPSEPSARLIWSRPGAMPRTSARPAGTPRASAAPSARIA
jgi:hypothetical protein